VPAGSWKGFPVFKRGYGYSALQDELADRMRALRAGITDFSRTTADLRRDAEELEHGLAALGEWQRILHDAGARGEAVASAWPGAPAPYGPGYRILTSGAGIGAEAVVEDVAYWAAGLNGTAGVQLGLCTTLPANSIANGGAGFPETTTPLTDVRIRDVVLGSSWKWAQRAYRWQSNIELEHCSWLGVEKEHGSYVNMAGLTSTPDPARLLLPALVYRGCLWAGVASQCVQNVGAASRPTETDALAKDDTLGGEIQVLDSYAFGNNWDDDGVFSGTRAGFAFSFFGTRNHVRIERLWVDHSMQKTSFGGIELQGLSTLSLDPDIVNSVNARGDFLRNAVIHDLVLAMNEPSQPMIQGEEMNDVIITGSHFACSSSAAQKKLDFKHHRGRLVLSGCTQEGGISVVVNGSNLGLITPHMVWP